MNQRFIVSEVNILYDQSRISPSYQKESIQCDTKVSIIDIRNVFDINAWREMFEKTKKRNLNAWLTNIYVCLGFIWRRILAVAVRYRYWNPSVAHFRGELWSGTSVLLYKYTWSGHHQHQLYWQGRQSLGYFLPPQKILVECSDLANIIMSNYIYNWLSHRFRWDLQVVENKSDCRKEEHNEFNIAIFSQVSSISYKLCLYSHYCYLNI